MCLCNFPHVSIGGALVPGCHPPSNHTSASERTEFPIRFTWCQIKNKKGLKRCNFILMM